MEPEKLEKLKELQKKADESKKDALELSRFWNEEDLEDLKKSDEFKEGLK